MGRNEYIPPPVTKENKAEYFEELSNINKADEWIKKHSIKVQQIENVEPNIKPKNQTMEVDKEYPGSIKALGVVLLSIPIFAFYISSYPNVDITDFFIYLVIYLIIPLTFAALSPKNHEEKNQSSNGVNKTEQNYEEKNQSSNGVNKTEQNFEEKIEDESFSFFLVIADIMKYTILILVILFLFMMIFMEPILDSLFSGGCYGVCGLSGWGGP